MRARDRLKLEKLTARMEHNSRLRLRQVKKFKGIKPDLIDLDMTIKPDVKPKRKLDLKWRRYKQTKRTHLKAKRIKVVETTKKGSQSYTISGINRKEFNKFLDIIHQ